MGYTHYLDEQRKASDDEMKKLKIFAFKLFLISYENEEPLGNINGESYSLPIIENNFIGFNGVGIDGYESACFDADECELSFCKTARKPYDRYVVAFFSYIDYLGIADFTSDGSAADMIEGENIMNEVINKMS